jgi:glycosyltransferase involved in cell wall biosynthesis
VPVYPGLGGEYGADYLHRHAAQHFGGDPKGGMVLTLMDVWVLPPQLGGALNLVSWTPVDHEPAPPMVRSFFVSGAVPLAMSRFGERELADLDPLYCPHGVDTNVFRPMDRRTVRREVGLPDDAFLVGMVAANKGRPSRKGFQQAFEAFRLLSQKHDDAYLYLHTTVDPNVSQGENLKGLLGALGVPADRVLTADQYRQLFSPLPPTAMAKVYSAMDILVNPAAGEGFGIPVLEAQACGVPVVVTNFSAMPEVGKVGWQVGCRPQWTAQNSWQAQADVGEIAKAFEQCYGLSNRAKADLSERARKHALSYDAKWVFDEFMLPALKAAESRFEDRKPLRLVSKAAEIERAAA